MNTTCPPRFTVADDPFTPGPTTAVARTLDPIPAELALPAGVLIPIDPRPNLTLRALAGDLWITQTGNPHDVLLSTGQSFTPARRGRIVIQALTAARLSLTGLLAPR